MKDVSIEYGHIYTDKEFSREQIRSIRVKSDVAIELDNQGLSHEDVIMIDDYSPLDGDSFDYRQFESKLREYYGSPDLIIMESDLLDINIRVIELMRDNSLKRQLTSNIEKNQRHPCSLFITSWYLIRLGLIENIFGITPCFKLINILDRRFKQPEKSAKAIISNIYGKEILERIENIYI